MIYFTIILRALMQISIRWSKNMRRLGLHHSSNENIRYSRNFEVDEETAFVAPSEYSSFVWTTGSNLLLSAMLQ